MKIFKRLEEKLFTGKVIKDYGILDEKKVAGSRMRTSILLCRRGRKFQLVFRNSAVAPLGASVNFSQVEATPELLNRLAEIVLDAGEIIRNDVSK